MSRVENASVIKEKLRQMGAAKRAQFLAGLIKLALYIQSLSQKIVPVDYGPLKASAFTRNDSRPGLLRVTVGYTAAYAVFVHENPEALHGAWFNEYYAAEIAKKPKKGPYRHSRGPNQSYKFLEKSWKEAMNSGAALAILAGEIQ